MSAKDRANLNIFVHSMPDDAVQMTVQCFNLWRKKDSSVLLSTRDKRVAITFHQNQRLNIGNQYDKDTTQLAPEVIEKFKKPHITPHQIDETLRNGKLSIHRQSKLQIRFLT